MNRLSQFDQALRTGSLDRRGFGKLAAMLGAGASMASLLPGRAQAQDAPQKGGDLSIGITGGASTDSLKPAAGARLDPGMHGIYVGQLPRGVWGGRLGRSGAG